MAILAKKIHIINSAGTEQTVNLYSTTGEVATAASYTYQNVDGIECYAPLVSPTDANATSGRVEKNGTTYAWGVKAPVPAYSYWTSGGGSGTFTVPTGVNKLRVTCVGGGAGGGIFPRADCDCDDRNLSGFVADGNGHYYHPSVGGGATVFGSVVGNGATPWRAGLTSSCCTGTRGEGTTYTYCNNTVYAGAYSYGTAQGWFYDELVDYVCSAGAVPLTNYAGGVVFSAGAGGCTDGHSCFRRGFSGGSGYTAVAVINVTPGQVISWSVGGGGGGWKSNSGWCWGSCSSAGINATAGGAGGILVEWGQGIE